MKVQKPNAPPLSFGTCKSVESLKRYLKDEGFLLAKARCCDCEHRWTMAIEPWKLNHSLQLLAEYATQPCPKCSSQRTIVNIPPTK
jgi:hypothetical protein